MLKGKQKERPKRSTLQAFTNRNTKVFRVNYTTKERGGQLTQNEALQVVRRAKEQGAVFVNAELAGQALGVAPQTIRQAARTGRTNLKCVVVESRVNVAIDSILERTCLT